MPEAKLNWIELRKKKQKVFFFFFPIKALLIQAHSVLYNWLINARSEENVAKSVERSGGKEGKNVLIVTFSKQITHQHLPACTTAGKL